MNAIISSLHHLEYFVLDHSKKCCSAEKSVTLLIILVFRPTIVRKRKIGITVGVLVAFICDIKVMTSSHRWPPIKPIINCFMFLSLNECHFFPQLKLQQERTARRISDEFTFFISLPFVWGKCGDGPVEFSADNDDSVCDIVTVLVECSSLKIML